MYRVANIAEDLRRLELEPGDTVLARAALKAMGPVEGQPATVLIEALLDVVGDAGTVVALSHTKPRRRSDRSNVFTRDTPCITGGFAAAMLEWDGAVRSRHPTNSMVAVGRDAESLLAGHDETSTCFAPMRALIERDAKMVLIGCVESSPGFSTLHGVYEDIGLARRSMVSGIYGAYFEEDGQLRWFARRDVPGCSMGFGRLYPLYEQQGALHSGTVGDADSRLITCRDAYAIEYEAVRSDPTISLCDRADCFSCRGTKLFNLADMPRFYVRRPALFARVLAAQALRIVRPGG